MCGIVGCASRAAAADRHLLDVQRDAMRHRGPDDAGSWWSADGGVGLAMRRLAILDLSPAGHQPMSDSTGRLWLVFNGEIYNHQDLRAQLTSRGRRFRGGSDSEVLLEAYSEWGTSCLERLNGMFAFAIWDSELRELVLARDRVGEKPLFYHHAEGRLVFASELKALLADPCFPRTLDVRAFKDYLAYGYVPGKRCILRGVHKLAPAHVLRYRLDADALAVSQYWQLPDPAPAGANVAEQEEELESLLLDSVRLRLVADVPVGVLLSGGLDSSLVTALATRASGRPVRTFTVRFPGHDAFDEGPHAAQVARHFGTEHSELTAEATSVDLLPTLAAQFDEPMADSSMVPTYLVSRLIREHATVALGGDGGDELFGGYPHYSWLLRQPRWRRTVPRPVRAAIGGSAAHLLPIGVRGRHHLIGFAGPAARSVAHVNLHFDAVARRRLVAPDLLRAAGGERPEDEREAGCDETQSVLQQATRADFSRYLPDDILVKVDRASMLASLEVRAPWLDHRIIELAFGRVPDDLRATTREKKILPRRLAARLLPASLDLTRKQGFSLPLAAWFKGRWGETIAGIVSDSDPRIFNRRATAALIAGQRRGLANTTRLFNLAMFELWRRRYEIRLP
jgi:asparagine synthase (glutamine-hydrolysing)